MSQNYLEHSLKSSVPERTISDLVFEYADKHADKVCQIDILTGGTETFKSLKLRSIRLAIQLQTQFNLTPKDVIVTCLPNSLDSSLPVLAGLFLGCKVANLHPALSAWQTTYLINLVQPVVLFTDLDNIALIEESLQNVENAPRVVVSGKTAEHTNLFDLLTPHKTENNFRPVPVDLDKTALIFFSSGTTGLPKGICHSHRSFMVFISVEEPYNHGIRVQLQFSTYYWISGVLMLMRSFLYGRTRAFVTVPDGSAILAAIEKYKINCMFTAPVYTYILVNSPDFDKYKTKSLKRMVVGGTPISVSQIHKLQSAFPHTKIIVAYGLSETATITMLDCASAMDKLKSVGKIQESFKLKIVDTKTSQPLGPNENGEVCIKSPSVMTGYYRQDSSKAFDKDGWLKTGDVGYYDADGYVYIIGRLKEMFKYKSWHIVPAMIEAIIGEHPAVQESVVFGIPAQCEEDGEIPSACIVLKKNVQADEEEIKKFVSEKVSDYEQLRGIVVFVDSLPRGPTGKIVRSDVKDMVMKRLKDNAVS